MIISRRSRSNYQLRGADLNLLNYINIVDSGLVRGKTLSADYIMAVCGRPVVALPTSGARGMAFMISACVHDRFRFSAYLKRNSTPLKVLLWPVSCMYVYLYMIYPTQHTS